MPARAGLEPRTPIPGLVVCIPSVSQWAKLTCPCCPRELGKGWTLQSASLADPRGPLWAAGFHLHTPGLSFRGHLPVLTQPRTVHPASHGHVRLSDTLPLFALRYPWLIGVEMIRASWASEPIQPEELIGFRSNASPIKQGRRAALEGGCCLRQAQRKRSAVIDQ